MSPDTGTPERLRDSERYPGVPVDVDGVEPRLLGPDALDQLAGMVMTLGMELAVALLRIGVLEARLHAADIGPLEGTAQDQAEREAASATDDLVQRLLANILPDRGHARPLVDQQFHSGERGS